MRVSDLLTSRRIFLLAAASSGPAFIPPPPAHAARGGARRRALRALARPPPSPPSRPRRRLRRGRWTSRSSRRAERAAAAAVESLGVESNCDAARRRAAAVARRRYERTLRRRLWRRVRLRGVVDDDARDAHPGPIRLRSRAARHLLAAQQRAADAERAAAARAALATGCSRSSRRVACRRCPRRAAPARRSPSWRRPAAAGGGAAVRGYPASYKLDDTDVDDALWRRADDPSPTRLVRRSTRLARRRAAAQRRPRGARPRGAGARRLLRSCGARLKTQEEYFIDDTYRPNLLIPPERRRPRAHRRAVAPVLVYQFCVRNQTSPKTSPSAHVPWRPYGMTPLSQAMATGSISFASDVQPRPRRLAVVDEDEQPSSSASAPGRATKIGSFVKRRVRSALAPRR